MFLRELFDRTVRLNYIAEGGNLVIGDVAADKIDTKQRSKVVPILDQALVAINNAFAKSHKGVPIWSPKLLAS